MRFQIPRSVLLAHKSELWAAVGRFTCLLFSQNFCGSGFNMTLWWGGNPLFPKGDPRVFFLFPMILFCPLGGTHPVGSLSGKVLVNL